MTDAQAKIRQLALLEYRRDHNEQKTVKTIRNIFGFNSVDLTAVRSWFKTFGKNEIEKFEKKSEYDAELSEQFPDGFPRIINSMLSQVKGGSLFKTMRTCNGRIGCAVGTKKFIVCDMFHGDVRTINNNFFGEHCSSPVFIDDKHFLIIEKQLGRIALFELDLDALSLKNVNVVAVLGNLQKAYIILDELSLNRYGVFNETSFCIGKIDANDRFVEDSIIHIHDHLKWPTLRGQEVLAFVRGTATQLYRLNLETHEREIINIPTVFKNGKRFKLNSYYSRNGDYFWSGDYFYITYGWKTQTCKVLALNIKTNEWSETGIETLNQIYKIYVDEDGFLTAITGGILGTTTFYRFPLQKPDSLINLSWFSLTSNKKKTGKRGYNSLFNRVPYTCHIRPQLPPEKN